MIITPKVRNHFCTTAHPLGCAVNVDRQIETVESFEPIPSQKNVLVIGCSTGYGLSSRIASSFGSRAATLGIMFERPPTEKRTATAGWYNNVHFEERATNSGLKCHTINGDAFSLNTKLEAIERLKEDYGQIDMLVYSLAAPRRHDPVSGMTWQSALKPIGKSFDGITANPHTEDLKLVSLDPATNEEIDATIKVMGGEDWYDWVQILKQNNLLSPSFKTISYSYLGGKVTWPIYGDATIGLAKKDLECYASKIDQELSELGGRAHVGVLQATVTQSSSAIPVFPLYISMLLPLMKLHGLYETDIEHILRLYSGQLLYPNTKQNTVLRTDDRELSETIQRQIIQQWQALSPDTLSAFCDFKDYRKEFLSLFGFGIEGIDYTADIDPIRCSLKQKTSCETATA